MATSALKHARRGAVFAIVAALLLASPLYVGLFVDHPRERSPTGYTAMAVDPANASDQETIIRQLGHDEILDLDRLAEADADPRTARYRAPGRAATLLRKAREQGTARTGNESASFTLHRLAANHRYVTFPNEATGQYYRLSVEERNGTMIVTLSEASQSMVAEYIVYSDARRYTSLPEYQRETVDKVIAADRAGYRPYNEEFHELIDNLLVKNGTYYLFVEGIHVDDFGFTTRAIVIVGLSVLGLLAFLVGLGFTALAYRSSPSAE